MFAHTVRLTFCSFDGCRPAVAGVGLSLTTPETAHLSQRYSKHALNLQLIIYMAGLKGTQQKIAYWPLSLSSVYILAKDSHNQTP